MKISIVCFFLAVGLAHGGLLPATTLVRTPAYDSAIIKSDRLGGSFAYSTVEGHAYAAISPVVQRIAEPVAISYTAHPVHYTYAAAPLVAQAPVYYAAQQFLSPAVVAPLPAAEAKPEAPKAVEGEAVSVESA